MKAILKKTTKTIIVGVYLFSSVVAGGIFGCIIGLEVLGRFVV